MTLDEATVRALRLVDVEAMQSARDNREYDPQAMPTVWYWPADGYDSIKRVDAATIRALAADWLAMRAERDKTRNVLLHVRSVVNRADHNIDDDGTCLACDALARLDAVLKGEW